MIKNKPKPQIKFRKNNLQVRAGQTFTDRKKHRNKKACRGKFNTKL